MLDTSVGHANPYASAGSPDLDRVLSVVRESFSRFEVAGAALTAYDPRVDDTGGIAAAAREIAHHIARLA